MKWTVRTVNEINAKSDAPNEQGTRSLKEQDPSKSLDSSLQHPADDYAECACKNPTVYGEWPPDCSDPEHLPGFSTQQERISRTLEVVGKSAVAQGRNAITEIARYRRCGNLNRGGQS